MEDFNPAPYMRWAKYRPGARYDLSGSSPIACTREDPPGIMGDLPLTGPGPEGYPPLFEAIGRRYSAGPEQIAHASCHLGEHETAVVPGRFFGAPSHFRVAFGVAPETLERGLTTALSIEIWIATFMGQTRKTVHTNISAPYQSGRR